MRTGRESEAALRLMAMVMGPALPSRPIDHGGEQDDRDSPVVQRPIDDWFQLQKDSSSKFPEHIHMSTSGKSILVRAGSGRIIVAETRWMQEAGDITRQIGIEYD